MLFRMAVSPAHISSHVVWSRPQTSETVSRRDPPILSILILHSLMDLVAAAQLSFPAVCTDASLLSNCSAHVTEMLLCCSAFASVDQKSPVASSHFYSSISWISSTKESHNHSSKVQFKPASMMLKQLQGTRKQRTSGLITRGMAPPLSLSLLHVLVGVFC